MKKKEVSFVQEHSIAIVSTYGGLRVNGVPIYYLFIKEDNAFYFLTNNQTQKHANIEENNKAAITIFTENPPVVFTASCVAEVFDLKSEEYSEHIYKLVAIHSSREFYPTPLLTFKNGDISLIKLSVEGSKLKSYKEVIDLLKA